MAEPKRTVKDFFDVLNADANTPVKSGTHGITLEDWELLLKNATSIEAPAEFIEQVTDGLSNRTGVLYPVKSTEDNVSNDSNPLAYDIVFYGRLN